MVPLFPLVVTLATSPTQERTVRVSDSAALRREMSKVKPGSRILLEPGDYSGGLHVENVHGSPGHPVVLASADPNRPARFSGGGSTLQFSDVSYLEIRDLVISKPLQNGLNIDDGGSYDTPSHHVTVRNLRISDLPSGNHDGIKLSGVDDFRIENCTIERWGGSAVDMVGCHRGVVENCQFREGGANGVQMKGGTAEITVRSSRFDRPGQRGVNLGGSTGLPFFRPPIESVRSGRRAEARNVVVEGCTFVGGVAAIAFVGVDGATVRFNTIYQPERWAIRILQETATPDFVPCRNGVFTDNLVAFRSDWASGGVNVGPGTAPGTFRFERNWWYCVDRPARSAPTLPTSASRDYVGRDPRFVDPAVGDLRIKADSPARRFGAHALPK